LRPFDSFGRVGNVDADADADVDAAVETKAWWEWD